MTIYLKCSPSADGEKQSRLLFCDNLRKVVSSNCQCYSARRADCLGLLCHMLSVLCLIYYLHIIVAVLISVEVNVSVKKEKMIIQSLEFLSKNVVVKNEYFAKESNYISMASLHLQDHRNDRHILIGRDLLRFSGLLASCLNHAEY